MISYNEKFSTTKFKTILLLIVPFSFLDDLTDTFKSYPSCYTLTLESDCPLGVALPVILYSINYSVSLSTRLVETIKANNHRHN